MANRGGYVAAAAPGVDVVAPGVGGAVQLSSGTSIAAAEASGVVALLLQEKPGLGADEVRKVLSETALRVTGDAGAPMQVIDALAALQAMGSKIDPPSQSGGEEPPRAVEGRP
jgi:Subtilase family.